jgi:hypothetical protein
LLPQEWPTDGKLSAAHVWDWQLAASPPLLFNCSKQQVKERTKRSIGQKALAKAHENGCDEEVRMKEGKRRRKEEELARRFPPPLLLLLLSLASLPHPMATYSPS